MPVSRALHEIADRLDASGRAAHQPNPIDARGGYYPDTDTEYVRFFFNFTLSLTLYNRSTVSSHDWRHSPRRGRSQGGRLNRSETEPHGGHVHDNRTQRWHSRDVAPPQDPNHPGATPHLSQDRAARSNPNYSEPRVARRSNYSEPRVARRLFASRSEYGRDGQLDGSPPPSPTPLQRRSSHQPPQSLSSHQGLGARVPTQPHSAGVTASSPNDIILGNIFDLDEQLVRRRTPDCDPSIHRPARGIQGSQSRWYFVCCGRRVGIFNEWCVCGCCGSCSLLTH